MNPRVPNATTQSAPRLESSVARTSLFSTTSTSPSLSTTTHRRGASRSSDAAPSGSSAPEVPSAPRSLGAAFDSADAASSGSQQCATYLALSRLFPNAEGSALAELSVILNARNDPSPLSDAVAGSEGFHAIWSTAAGVCDALARAGKTAAHLFFSHCHSATFHSGAPPCAKTHRPSGLKLRETYSLPPTSAEESTLRRLREARSYTAICAFSARSATARYLRFGLSARAVIPSVSAEHGMKRWVLDSTWYSTIWCPAGYSTVDSST